MRSSDHTHGQLPKRASNGGNELGSGLEPRQDLAGPEEKGLWKEGRERNKHIAVMDSKGSCQREPQGQHLGVEGNKVAWASVTCKKMFLIKLPVKIVSFF